MRENDSASAFWTSAGQFVYATRRRFIAFLLMVLAIIDWGMLIANTNEYIDLQAINLRIQNPLMEYGIVGLYKAFKRAEGHCWSARDFSHDTYTGCDGGFEYLERFILDLPGNTFDKNTAKDFREWLCKDKGIGCHDYNNPSFLDVIPYAVSELWGTGIGWWMIWLLGFICMILAGGKKDILAFISAAIFAPFVVTFIIGIFSISLILLSIILGDVLGLLAWLNGLAVTGGIVSFSIALAKRRLRLDDPKRYV